MSVDLWCPFAERHEIPGHPGAGSMLGGQPKIVHHSTEGDGIAGAIATYAKTGDLPHFTDTFEGGRYRAVQHLPLNVAATALKHPAGTGETNRDNVVQIEHVGHAATSHTWPVGYLDEIAVLCRWIELQTGCARAVILPFIPGGVRLPWSVWHTSSGHCGHMHVPYNDHFDPGAMDIGRVLTAGQPGPDPTPAPNPEPVVEDDMQPVAVDPETGDFWVLTGPAGGIDALDAGGQRNQRYYGNLIDHPEYNAGDGKPLGPAIGIIFWPQGRPLEGLPPGGYAIITRAPDGSYHPYHFDASTVK